jgi:hypothetical protein
MSRDPCTYRKPPLRAKNERELTFNQATASTRNEQMNTTPLQQQQPRCTLALTRRRPQPAASGLTNALHPAKAFCLSLNRRRCRIVVIDHASQRAYCNIRHLSRPRAARHLHTLLQLCPRGALAAPLEGGSQSRYGGSSGSVVVQLPARAYNAVDSALVVCQCAVGRGSGHSCGMLDWSRRCGQRRVQHTKLRSRYKHPS